jgi:hypothetical protein
MIEAGAWPRDPSEGCWARRVVTPGASKAVRPTPFLSGGLVRSAFFSVLDLRGDPSDSPRRGCAPTDPAGVCVLRVRGLDFVGAPKAARPTPFLPGGLVRSAFCESIHSEGTPLGHPAHGLRPRYPCRRPQGDACAGSLRWSVITPHPNPLPTGEGIHWDARRNVGGLRWGAETSPSLPRVPLLARRGTGDGGAVGGLRWGAGDSWGQILRSAQDDSWGVCGGREMASSLSAPRDGGWECWLW